MICLRRQFVDRRFLRAYCELRNVSSPLDFERNDEGHSKGGVRRGEVVHRGVGGGGWRLQGDRKRKREFRNQQDQVDGGYGVLRLLKRGSRPADGKLLRGRHLRRGHSGTTDETSDYAGLFGEITINSLRAANLFTLCWSKCATSSGDSLAVCAACSQPSLF